MLFAEKDACVLTCSRQLNISLAKQRRAMAVGEATTAGAAGRIERDRKAEIEPADPSAPIGFMSAGGLPHGAGGGD
jgi:hypothetical protein